MPPFASTDVIRMCRDVDCPCCGFPETYAEVDFSAPTPGPMKLGCTRQSDPCGWTRQLRCPHCYRDITAADYRRDGTYRCPGCGEAGT